MIYPEDETIIVNHLCCSKDEAVAKMLGWMRSPVRLKYIKVTSAGIQPDQLEHLHSIEGSILDFLNDQRKFASDSLKALAEEAADTQDEEKKSVLYDLINQHDDAIIEWHTLTSKASVYLDAINTELAKDNHSKLKIDTTHISDSNKVFITLSSLNEWTKSTYAISIYEESELTKPATNSALKEPQRADPLREEIIEILSTMQNPRPAKVMAALKARIGLPGTCVVGDIGYGIKWTNNKNDDVELNMKALTSRLNSLKKL